MEVISLKKAKELGLPRYYTGVPCSRGHTDERLVSTRSCRSCSRDKSRERMKEIRSCPEIREKMNQQWRDWYHSGNSNKRVLASKSWAQKNRDKVRKNNRKSISRFRKTEIGIIDSFMRKSIYRCVNNKTDSTEQVLGYKREDLLNIIEGLFLEGMSWSNHGMWHIDHIRPVSSFLKSGVTDPKIINSLDNLQPLWARDNISKGNKYNGPQ